MILPKQDTAFVAAIEDVLDVYKWPHDPLHPVVALDEEPVHLVADTRSPLPVRPGDTAKVDHKHARNGSAKGVRRVRAAGCLGGATR